VQPSPTQQFGRKRVAFVSMTKTLLKAATMIELSRGEGQSIAIGDDIIIEVIAVDGDEVRLGIKHPNDMPVNEEVGQGVALEGAS
jgi:carbon storage regulator